MRDYGRENAGLSFNTQSLLQVIRAVGGGLGAIAIVTGLVYATRMFTVIFSILRAPEVFQAHMGKWVAAVGGAQLDVVVGGIVVHGAAIFAIFILGGGAAILAWISMGLILAGAKTMSWILGDREAVKKLLVHAFGPARKPEPGKAVEGDNP